VVAGHCLGANIAIEFAARYPAKAAGLVLIEPMFRAALTGHMRRIARLRPLFLPAAGLVRALNALGVHRRRLAPLDLEALDRETRGAIAARRAADAALARYASPVLDLRTTPTLTYLRALIAVTRELPELSTIAVPVLALLASGSRFTDPVRTEAALAALPHLDLERLPARHWIPTEEPEAMRRAIERWCSALPAGPP
jgi:pimeloyl-ACP methyl ester carboxylesterase